MQRLINIFKLGLTLPTSPYYISVKLLGIRHHENFLLNLYNTQPCKNCWFILQ